MMDPHETASSYSQGLGNPSGFGPMPTGNFLRDAENQAAFNWGKLHRDEQDRAQARAGGAGDGPSSTKAAEGMAIVGVYAYANWSAFEAQVYRFVGTVGVAWDVAIVVAAALVFGMAYSALCDRFFLFRWLSFLVVGSVFFKFVVPWRGGIGSFGSAALLLVMFLGRLSRD